MLEELLAPLDYPRQSLYNLGRGLGRIGQGQASLQDLAGMAPGAAGALTSAMFGLPAGALVGGGLQGLGKLLSPETFEAPGAESLVEALGGDPESWGQRMAAHLASDPMMWMGVGQGTRLGMGLASDLRRPGMPGGPVGRFLADESGAIRDPRMWAGQPAGDIFNTPAIETLPKLSEAPIPVSRLAPAPPPIGPAPPGPVPYTEADIVGTPSYLRAVHARNEAQAIQEAAAEAVPPPMNPLMARLEAGRGQAAPPPPPPGPVAPSLRDKLDAIQDQYAARRGGWQAGELLPPEAVAHDPWAAVPPGVGVEEFTPVFDEAGSMVPEAPVIRPGQSVHDDLAARRAGRASFFGPLARQTDELYSIYADLLQDVKEGGALAGGPSVFQRAQIARDLIFNESQLGRAGVGSMDEVKLRLLARARDDLSMVGSLAGDAGWGTMTPTMLRGVHGADAATLRRLSSAAEVEDLVPEFYHALRFQHPSSRLVGEAKMLGELPLPRVPGVMRDLEAAGFPIDPAGVNESYLGNMPARIADELSEQAQTAHYGWPPSASSEIGLENLRNMLGQKRYDDLVRTATERANTMLPNANIYEGSETLRQSLDPLASRATLDLMAEHGLGRQPELLDALLDIRRPGVEHEVRSWLEMMGGRGKEFGPESHFRSIEPGFSKALGAMDAAEAKPLFAQMQQLARSGHGGLDIPPEQIEPLLQQLMAAYRAKMGF